MMAFSRQAVPNLPNSIENTLKGVKLRIDRVDKYQRNLVVLDGSPEKADRSPARRSSHVTRHVRCL